MKVSDAGYVAMYLQVSIHRIALLVQTSTVFITSELARKITNGRGGTARGKVIVTKIWHE